ncbi:MAG: LEA type 2 family protein [Deltaproteobacteria bacterium]|nr:LEA type 2 family protein [Deltaproteobacteria bacterium]MBW2660759.1 LEA type 2 family protein [Deltaproteobacteria bacterium]
MGKKSFILIAFSFVVIAAMLFGCGEKKAQGPTEQNFKAPIVTLKSVEVAHYWGWWYFSSKVAPTKGAAGNYGAPLDLAFVFDVQNPNSYPILMDSLKFTVAFDEFDLNSLSSMETQWIPAGKTNQLRVHGMFDGRQSLLSLLVTGGFKLKEKGVGAFDQLEKWWVGVPEFTFPISVKEGAAVFKADGLTKVAVFTGTFPK